MELRTHLGEDTNNPEKSDDWPNFDVLKTHVAH